MTDPSRLSYDDSRRPSRCTLTARQPSEPPPPQLERAAHAAVEPAPSIYFEDFPREVTKRDIKVSDAAARLANALHLHLD